MNYWLYKRFGYELWILLAAVFVFSGTNSALGTAIFFRGSVIDSGGQPTRARLGWHWSADFNARHVNSDHVNDRRFAPLIPDPSYATDPSGHFTLAIDPKALPRILMIIDDADREGTARKINADSFDSCHEFRLSSLSELDIDIDASALSGQQNSINVWFFSSLLSGRSLGEFYLDHRPFLDPSPRRPRKIRLQLPTGDYDFAVRSSISRIERFQVGIAPRRNQREFIHVKLRPPEIDSLSRLCATGKVNTKSIPTLSDWRGKWVIVEFWAYWC